MKVKLNGNDLTKLLEIVKRKQTVNGKAQAQGESCILMWEDGVASITTVTRDMGGLTHVQCNIDAGDSSPSGMIPITDIDTFLGALKYHAPALTLSFDLTSSKIKLKSSNKQTTLSGSTDALAFSHSTDTLMDFRQKSVSFSEKIDVENMTYKTNNGQVIPVVFQYETTANHMFEALRCDEMNGQKLNSYTFNNGSEGFYVTVGGLFKGQTEVQLSEPIQDTPDWEWEFGGGLSELFKHFDGECKIGLFDFTAQGQGMRMLIDFGNGCWALQAGLL